MFDKLYLNSRALEMFQTGQGADCVIEVVPQTDGQEKQVFVLFCFYWCNLLGYATWFYMAWSKKVEIGLTVYQFFRIVQIQMSLNALRPFMLSACGDGLILVINITQEWHKRKDEDPCAFAICMICKKYKKIVLGI
jgi:hypothetical protein